MNTAPEHNHHYRINWSKCIVYGITIITTLYLLYYIRSIFMPIIIGIILFYILEPLVEFQQQNKIFRFLPRGIAILMAYLIFIFTIVMVYRFIVPPFISEFNNFTNNLPHYIKNSKEIYNNLQNHYLSYQLPEFIRTTLEKAIQETFGMIVKFSQNIFASTLKFAAQFIKLLIIPIIAFFLLLDKEKIRSGLTQAIPEHHRENFGELLSKINHVLINFLKGQVMLCLIIGASATLGLFLLGVDYALILGLIAGITEAIPILGPWIGGAPAVLIALMVSPSLALKVIIFYFIIQLLENNFLVPKLMSNYLKLHPIVIIISILICGELFGGWGFFIATPLAAILKEIFMHLKNQAAQAEIKKGV